MWESRGDRRLEFVYLLEWADESARDRACQAFMADPEWSATASRYGRLVGAIEDRSLRRADYSPAALPAP